MGNQTLCLCLPHPEINGVEVHRSRGPASDNPFYPNYYLVKHNKSLWVWYTDVSLQKNYWQELQDNGEWSRVSSAIALELPNHLAGNVEAVVSVVFMP